LDFISLAGACNFMVTNYSIMICQCTRERKKTPPPSAFRPTIFLSDLFKGRNVLVAHAASFSHLEKEERERRFYVNLYFSYRSSPALGELRGLDH
jgi:hypothetical protein